MGDHVNRIVDLLEGSAKTVTGSWSTLFQVNVGSYKRYLFRPDVDINDYKRLQFKVLERITSLTGGNTYGVSPDAISDDIIYIEDQILELKDDIDQRMTIQLDTLGIKYLEVQVRALTATGNAALVSSVYGNGVANY